MENKAIGSSVSVTARSSFTTTVRNVSFTDLTFSLFFKRFYLFIFLERGDGKEKERERNISMWLPPKHPPSGTWPATQACAPTGNRTGNALVHRPTLNPLSYTSQG